MTNNNKLQLNDDRMAALIISAPRILNFTSFPPNSLKNLIVGNLAAPFSQSAKNLGVTFDMHLTIYAHVAHLIQTANFELHPISSTCQYLSVQATKTLVSAYVLLQLDRVQKV